MLSCGSCLSTETVNSFSLVDKTVLPVICRNKTNANLLIDVMETKAELENNSEHSSDLEKLGDLKKTT